MSSLGSSSISQELDLHDAARLQGERTAALRTLQPLEDRFRDIHKAIHRKPALEREIQALNISAGRLTREMEQFLHPIQQLEERVADTDELIQKARVNLQRTIESAQREKQQADLELKSADESVKAARADENKLEAELELVKLKLRGVSNDSAPIKNELDEIDARINANETKLTACDNVLTSLGAVKSQLAQVPDWLRSLPRTLAKDANLSAAMTKRFDQAVKQTDFHLQSTAATIDRLRCSMLKDGTTLGRDFDRYCDDLQKALKAKVEELHAYAAKTNRSSSHLMMFVAGAIAVAAAAHLAARAYQQREDLSLKRVLADWNSVANASIAGISNSNEPVTLVLTNVARRIEEWVKETIANLSALNTTAERQQYAAPMANQSAQNMMKFAKEQIYRWNIQESPVGFRHFNRLMTHSAAALNYSGEALKREGQHEPIRQVATGVRTVMTLFAVIGAIGMAFNGYARATNGIENINRLRDGLKERLRTRAREFVDSPEIAEFRSALKGRAVLADTSAEIGTFVSGMTIQKEKKDADVQQRVHVHMEALEQRLANTRTELMSKRDELSVSRVAPASRLDAYELDQQKWMDEQSQLQLKKQAALNALDVAENRLKKAEINLDKKRQSLAEHTNKLNQAPLIVRYQQQIAELKAQLQQRNHAWNEVHERHGEQLLAITQQLDDLSQEREQLIETIAKSTLSEDEYRDIDRIHETRVAPFIAPRALELAMSRHISLRDEELINRITKGSFTNAFGDTVGSASATASSYYSIYHLMAAIIEASELVERSPKSRDRGVIVEHRRPVGSSTVDGRDVQADITHSKFDFDTIANRKLITHIYPVHHA
ncbi:MAG TPA: hypothetical protein VFS42_01120 [Burkholderiaceae bacterium]|nr:hypothetical protein [Burkholderiaceae bacterium]